MKLHAGILLNGSIINLCYIMFSSFLFCITCYISGIIEWKAKHTSFDGTCTIMHQAVCGQREKNE